MASKSDTTDDHVTGVLLADLATKTLRRLEAAGPDRATCRQLAATIEQTADRMSFTVPQTDCVLVERDSSCPGLFEGGKH